MNAFDPQFRFAQLPADAQADAAPAGALGLVPGAYCFRRHELEVQPEQILEAVGV